MKGCSASEFVAAAQACVGIPFRHQGRNEYGLDCIGLVKFARLKCGPWALADKHDVTTYRRNPQARLAETLPRLATKIDEPELGAIALIQWPRFAHANHVGILTPGNIVHAYEEVKRVVETSYREPWLRWTVSLWRLQGMTQ